MGLFDREEKTAEELRQEIQDECYAMEFGAGISEVMMDYEDARTASLEKMKSLARSFGISPYK